MRKSNKLYLGMLLSITPAPLVWIFIHYLLVNGLHTGELPGWAKILIVIAVLAVISLGIRLIYSALREK